jgi:hypothetical protein
VAIDHHYCGGQPATQIARHAQSNHVMIATPTSRPFPTAYLMSMAATVEALVRFGVRFDLHVLDGDCHVDDARNHVFREFLLTDCTDLFFIDSDLGWSAEAFLRLLKADGDIVAGVYRHKHDEETYPFHPFPNSVADADGMFTVPKAPTGFMRIRRNVIEALYADGKTKGKWHWDGPEDEASGKPPMVTICERAYREDLNLTVDPGDQSRRYSGDLTLCLKARNLGFTVRVDIDMPFSHCGEKAWNGHLGNHLRGEQNVDSEQFVRAVDALKDRPGLPIRRVFEDITNHSHNPSYALPGAGLEACYHAAREAKGAILEVGSGLSTLVMGLAVDGTDTLIHTLENDLKHFHKTSAMLSRYGIRNVVLHYAPLMPYDGFDWYGVDMDSLPGAFDVAVIDGPARKLAKRDGLFKVMPERIKSARVWIVDDMADPRQAAMLQEYGPDRSVVIHEEMAGPTPHFYAIASLAA